MPGKLAGVRFQRAGRVHYCDPGDLELKVDDQVVVETDRGLDLGKVVIAPQQMMYAEVTEPPEPIVRLATPEDLAKGRPRGQS